MIKAVLLDLDDTLLLSPKDAFLQTLIKQMGDFFRDEFGIEDAREYLWKVGDQINKSLSPTRSNRAIWLDGIAELAPQFSAAQIKKGMDRFYREIYPDLQSFTKPDPVGRNLIEWLLKEGYIVVIATNPLYPAHAIDLRLEWAGLGDLLPYFSRVTNAENSHFTKAQPHYYEEIMCHVGLEPYEAVMVGDSWKNDMEPAARTGMRTFWVDDKSQKGRSDYMPDGQGSLEDFAFCAMQQNWLDSLTPREIKPDHLVPRLLGDVAALMGTLADMPERFWNQRPDPAEWSPMEIVAHLEESERMVQRPRLQTIARQDNPFLSTPKAPFQPGERDYTAQDGHQVALDFAAQRQQTVDFLQKLPADAWHRPARHSIFGPTSLLEMAVFTTRHDQLHIKQLCQTIGKCE